MHSSELAPNVPAITRQYIGFAIQEALTPALEEVWTEIQRLKAKPATPAPDIGTETKIEAAVADRLAAQLQTQIASHIEMLRAELAAATASTLDRIVEVDATVARQRNFIDALNHKIDKWASEDRYSITRAQVLKAMREASNGE